MIFHIGRQTRSGGVLQRGAAFFLPGYYPHIKAIVPDKRPQIRIGFRRILKIRHGKIRYIEQHILLVITL